MVGAEAKISCPACGQEHSDSAPGLGMVARCVRCGEPLRSGQRTAPGSLLPLSLAAAMCWIGALWLPVARMEKLGSANVGYLHEFGAALRAHGQWLLGWGTDALLLVFPTVLFALVPWVLAGNVGGVAARICDFSKRWAMPEVFVLAVLIAFAKLEGLGTASIEIGFWFLAAAVALMLWILQRCELGRCSRPKSNASAAAYMAAACVLLVPANILPIMAVTTPSVHYRSTIFDGVATLFSTGLWGVAVVVFIASALVPVCKLGGVAWLLLLARRQNGNRRAMNVYRVLDFIGRWSMLDIFLIAALAALVDFGSLARIEPGPAAPAFAAAVVLTILAMERIDTRSLWPPAVIAGVKPRPAL